MKTHPTTRLAPLALWLSACAAQTPHRAAFVRAERAADPPPPAPIVVEIPAPTPNAPQLKPLLRPLPKAERASSPEQVVLDANRRAAAAPDKNDTFNAIVQYAYEPGSLYQVFAAPMHVTDVVLEPGEKILGQPASGDVVRWVLAVGQSVERGLPQSHIYLKPTRADLQTNLAINTDRRTYLLELQSYPDTYMAAVTWHYPQDELAQLQLSADAAASQQGVGAGRLAADAGDNTRPPRSQGSDQQPNLGTRARS